MGQPHGRLLRAWRQYYPRRADDEMATPIGLPRADVLPAKTVVLRGGAARRRRAEQGHLQIRGPGGEGPPNRRKKFGGACGKGAASLAPRLCEPAFQTGRPAHLGPGFCMLLLIAALRKVGLFG